MILNFDLTAFNNPEGKFELVSGKTAETFKSFDGKKGVVDLNITFNEASGYGIIKDGKVLGIIEVVDDIKKVDLEKIIETYI